jgi:hypothetical protein
MAKMERIREAPANAPAVPKRSLRAKNGAGSDAILSVNAAVLRGTLIEVYPWVAETDAVAIEQYCRAEARARLLGDYLMEICENDGPRAVPGYIWKAATDADGVAMKAAAGLGLTPEGRLKIAKDAGLATHFQAENLRNLVDQGAQMRRPR